MLDTRCYILKSYCPKWHISIIVYLSFNVIEKQGNTEDVKTEVKLNVNTTIYSTS